MNRILFVILAVLLIVGVVASGYRLYLAPIEDVDIRVAEFLPGQYWLRIVSGEPSTCDECCWVSMMRFGNMVHVVVLNRHPCWEVGCGWMWSSVEHNFALGSCFIPGMKYIVLVNNVVKTFEVSWCGRIEE